MAVELPKAAIERIFRQGIGERRLSQEAKDVIYEFVPKMARYAADSSKAILDASGKKTLMEEHLKALTQVLMVDGAEEYDGELFGRATVRRILKEAGVERASADAVDLYNKLICRITEELGERAAEYADEDDRKTVQREDVERAITCIMPRADEFL
ncbi:histone-like protein [Methanopyrus sp.]|jgi:histone H3/H4